MFRPKLPSPSRPWRPCLLPGAPPTRPRIPATALPGRRRFLPPSAASASGSPPSRNSPLPPARTSSKNKSPDEIGRWKKVPPGMRESAVHETEDPSPSPPRTALLSARRRARAACRKVTSWVPRKARSVVLLNLVTLIFASNISVVKEAETLLDPDLFNMLRFTIAVIPFAPLLLKSLRDMRILVRGVELGLWVSMAYLAQAVGLLTADAGRSSFISALTVIIVPFLDGLVGAEVPAYTWFGAVLSLLGVAMLELSGSPPCVGDLLNLLSAFSFAIHMLRTEHISRNMKKENFSTLVGCEVFVVALVSAATYILKCFIRNVQHWHFKSWPPTELFGMAMSLPWPAILYTGIFSTSFCLWAEVAAMRDVSATETAIIYGLEPVWGAAFAWVMLGERWGMAGFVGAILIIVGSLMVQILGSIPDTSRGNTYQMNS
ncbi:hypothetical protein PAHAL_4G164500 [Panicum hallii]|uniref:EamA domain-containing protein n=1 Tax=Panicum hallii TaxID=206008 RepID=A0A2S3HJJ1_9POAL|nr:uncharacterized protein LOC112890665 isoform X1 [Panicum hallii]PAN24196.1 hypothetical protein PAHAL_4G164500 [Panicum hallii]